MGVDVSRWAPRSSKSVGGREQRAPVGSTPIHSRVLPERQSWWPQNAKYRQDRIHQSGVSFKGYRRLSAKSDHREVVTPPPWRPPLPVASPFWWILTLPQAQNLLLWAGHRPLRVAICVCAPAASRWPERGTGNALCCWGTRRAKRCGAAESWLRKLCVEEFTRPGEKAN